MGRERGRTPTEFCSALLFGRCKFKRRRRTPLGRRGKGRYGTLYSSSSGSAGNCIHAIYKKIYVYIYIFNLYF